jgi:AmmeMemoRadiSam system protein B
METKKKLLREASHAGSWYDSDRTKLLNNFLTWLNSTKVSTDGKILKGIIGPHAGYAYSGLTAAQAYININPSNYNRVFLLGPCHYMAIRGCGLPSCQEYETPFGSISIDTDIIQKLSKLDNFQTVSKDREEEEHSLEMHLPFIKNAFGNNPFTLIPIMVGSLNSKSQDYFGKIFSEYLKDDKTLFIISSDFCHWGNNFDYKPYNKEDGEIWESIEKLDKLGIDYIEKQDIEGFANYLNQTDNTICGRNPICVYLYALKYSGLSSQTKLVYYAQSNKVMKGNQTSVSYASILTLL